MMLRDDYRNKLDDDILNGFDMTENERHDVSYRSVQYPNSN